MSKRSILTILAAVILSAPLGAIDRGLGNPKSVYIPKGTVAISLTGGYNSWKATGEELTQGIEAFKKLAAGSLFTGKLSGIDIFSQTAELLWGVPFSGRPAALEGYVCSPPNKLVDYENDPHIIGYGKMTFEKEMTEYEKFHLDITYRSDRTPTMVTIVTSSSYLGDYFTGGSGSVIYFDEFKFIYY